MTNIRITPNPTGSSTVIKQWESFSTWYEVNFRYPPPFEIRCTHPSGEVNVLRIARPFPMEHLPDHEVAPRLQQGVNNGY